MIRFFRTILVGIIISIGLVTVPACDKDDEDRRRIPDVNVYRELNLTRQKYAPLQTNGGYVYISGGVKGIIVYRQTENNYRAFERNCPYRPDKSCARVKVDSSNLYIYDNNCCGSQFDFTGSPISGPVNRTLKRYSTSLQGNRLIISN